MAEKNADYIVAKGWLVVRSDGSLRVLKSARPALRADEVAWPLTVQIPKTWGRVQPGGIELTMPEPPDALITVEADPMTPPVEVAE